MKRLIIISLLFMALQSSAQDNYVGPEDTKVEMADRFRSSGKIYVVVAVLSTVLMGILFYTFNLDKRISKLEREEKVDQN